jgi:hypothetical protein
MKRSLVRAAISWARALQSLISQLNKKPRQVAGLVLGIVREGDPRTTVG